MVFVVIAFNLLEITFVVFNHLGEGFSSVDIVLTFSIIMNYTKKIYFKFVNYFNFHCHTSTSCIPYTSTLGLNKNYNQIQLCYVANRKFDISVHHSSITEIWHVSLEPEQEMSWRYCRRQKKDGDMSRWAMGLFQLPPRRRPHLISQYYSFYYNRYPKIRPK